MMMFLLLAGALVFSSAAKAQKIGFYFYPDVNVYYNPNTRQYAYQDGGNWVYHQNVPANYNISRHSHVVIYDEHPDVWRDNNIHREKYKNWDKRHKRKWKSKRH